MIAVALSSSTTSSDRNVSLIASWTRPSDRNGAFFYQVSYVGTQSGPYSNVEDTGSVEDSGNINITNTLDSNIVFMFDGLASAQYNMIVSAVNIKTGRSSPQVTKMNTTVAIGTYQLA